MRGQDSESPRADKIARVTDDQDLLLRKVGDLASVLQVLGIAVGDNACDLVLDSSRAVFDGAMGESSALAGTISVLSTAQSGFLAYL